MEYTPLFYYKRKNEFSLSRSVCALCVCVCYQPGEKWEMREKESDDDGSKLIQNTREPTGARSVNIK